MNIMYIFILVFYFLFKNFVDHSHKKKKDCLAMLIHLLPEHVLPLLSKVKPGLHEQLKLPKELRHSCSHPPLSMLHSFVSEKIFK